ncbi:MAG: family 1 glycosylhydrolase [Planctomycetaceae bacterium]|nr:family 1 glycosylhydrolase [Planctomycetaceae bacterium]MBV8381701.1 family 1 glycosylhydrolase [Planctomycetaceae bacterium]
MTTSIWDHFARQPGAIKTGETLEVACDHYHRFEDDAAGTCRRLWRTGAAG